MTDLSLQAGQGRTYKWFTGQPTFAFGAGMSFSSFSIALRPHLATGSTGDGASESSNHQSDLRYSVTIENVGSVPAAEVILVFSRVLQLVPEQSAQSELNADLPTKQLCAFDRTPVLAPGTKVSTCSS
jgi:hypothetical protein|eukprot:COSAG02_NODE_2468_length_8763_cov_3.000923_7_plen_128_part_00